MTLDKRPTRSRCFPFGDRRSVEQTLQDWARYRDPKTRECVRQIAISNDVADVLATALAIDDLRRLGAEIPFTVLTPENAIGYGACRADLHASCDELERHLLEHAYGASIEKAARPRKGDVVLLSDPSEAWAAGLPSRRPVRELAGLTEAAVGAGAGVVAVLPSDSTLAVELRSLRRRIEVVVYDGVLPFLSPILEGLVSRTTFDRLLVAGGQRVFGLAIGAVDMCIEYSGADPARLGRTAVSALARRVVVIESLWTPEPAGARLELRERVVRLLRAVGCECRSDARFEARGDGVRIQPVLGA